MNVLACKFASTLQCWGEINGVCTLTEQPQLNRETEQIYVRLSQLTLSLTETKITEFANSVDLDEVAHHEPPHLDLRWLPSSLCFLNMI